MAAHVPSRLYRSRSQKMLAGVCGGLGEYFDVDPVLIRLLFVVTPFISGAGILAYIVLWIVVPFEGDDTSRIDALKRDFDDVTGRVREYMDPPRGGPRPAPGQQGPGGQGGPDVTGFHGGFGPGSPGAPGSPGGFGSEGTGSSPFGRPGSTSGPAAPTVPFDTGREAAMNTDSTTARMPGSTDPAGSPIATPPPGTPGDPLSGTTATADRPGTTDAPDAAAAGSARLSNTDDDENPLVIDPPAGPAPVTPPPGTPPFGVPSFGPAAGGPIGPQPGAAPGTPPFGAPFGPPPGTPPFGTPFSGPAGGPYGGPAGGPFSNPVGGPAGSTAWSSAPRDGGPAFTSAPPPPTERKRRRQHWAGAILILIGLLILGNNLGLLWWVKMQFFMPLLLVGLGAWLMFGRGRRG